MSEKVRLFRWLLLEPLECRTVFSVDGLDLWQFSDQSLNFGFDRFQPAHHPHSETEILNIKLQTSALQNSAPQNRGINHSDEIQSVIYIGRRSTHGLSLHRGRFDDDSNPPLPLPEGEAHPVDSHPSSLDSTPAQVPTQPRETQVVVVIVTSPASAVLSQPRDLTSVSIPRAQVDSSNSNRANNHPISFAGGNSSLEWAPSSFSQNSPASSSIVSTSNTATQVNLANSSSPSLSAPLSGTTAFDFSSRLGSISEQPSATGRGGQRTDDFHFAKPQPVPSDSLFDQALVERAASLESLEHLLSGLAENHRRVRVQNGFAAHQPNLRSERNWRLETAASEEIAFADGGMIALALNRNIALSELEDISDDAPCENKAWTANVGIFRAFENDAVAATEYAGLTNRISRNEESSSTMEELSEVEGEVANSQLHPLLASTSAALGAVMLGLRRIRKSAPLMFTSRKR